MNPRVPDLLSRLIGLADTMLLLHGENALRPQPERSVMLGQVYGELVTRRRALAEGSPGFDDTAIMLNQCLMHLDDDAGVLGYANTAAKWAIISKSFLPFVRTDLALALTRAARPSTTEQAR